MKIHFFDSLQAVIRTGSLAGAAAEMNLTPSAVSMQMKQLEAWFGQPLFDRSRLQVQPTPFARQVAEVMRPALQRLELLRQHPASTVGGTVRLGVTESMQSRLLPGTLRHLRDAHPALQVLPVRGRSAELIDAVKAGSIDAAVVVEPEGGGARRLHWQALGEFELVLLAPPGSTQMRLPALFKAYDWVRFDPGTQTGRLAMRHVLQHAPQARATIELQSVQAVLAVVSAGLGVSVVVLPDPQLTLAYPVRMLALGADAPRLRMSLVARKADADHRLHAALRDALRSVLEAGPTAAGVTAGR